MIPSATFGRKAQAFYSSLSSGLPVPDGVEVLNPYIDPQVAELTDVFFRKFYEDEHPRVGIFGINPGRFGGGLTGISFTDPIQLQSACGIEHHLHMRPELSSTFVYSVISEYGGAEAFFRHFFLTALCPLGFTADGKNLNFYDRKDLEAMVRPFIISSIRAQIDFGLSQACCICLGEGILHKYFTKLNEEHGWFREIFALPHPRFILQYRRKQEETHRSGYLETLRSCEEIMNR
ncbi:MAG: DUF4918 family protein [Flavobacteriales bacterium]|nr:DUF4918 family protein [Flavobacteriales bacterium]MCB9448642.1 DUF4918 family protein [Flavobacteriales bacterium]